jgi:adenylosuccinate lyase
METASTTFTSNVQASLLTFGLFYTLFAQRMMCPLTYLGETVLQILTVNRVKPYTNLLSPIFSMI